MAGLVILAKTRRHTWGARLTVLRIVPGVAYRWAIVVVRSLVIAKQRLAARIVDRTAYWLFLFYGN